MQISGLGFGYKWGNGPYFGPCMIPEAPNSMHSILVLLLFLLISSLFLLLVLCLHPC